jgi:hypothetical protein
MQSKTKARGAKNPHNQFLYNYFQNLKIQCLSTGRDKLVFGYLKILVGIEKYPLPILTGNANILTHLEE